MPKGYFQEIVTGIFVAAVVVSLAFFTIVISGVDLLRGSRSTLRRVRFESIGALKVQDPVFVRGMKVGSVQALELGQGAVEVTLRVDDKVRLREDYAITVGTVSLLGGSSVLIAEGSEGAEIPPDRVLRGIPPNDMVRELGELVTDLRQAIDPAELRATLVNVRQASADIADLTGRIQRGEGFVGKLLSPDDSAYNDLRAGLANLRTLTDGLRDGKGLLGKLLREEDASYDDLRSALGNLREVTDGLRDGKGLLGKLLREDDTAYADLRDALANIRSLTARLNDPKSGFGRLLGQDSTLIPDLEATASNLRKVTAKLDHGEGTLGRLVNDEAIADEVEAAIKDVRQIIDNMRDTAPITTFTSLFFSGL